MYVTMDAGTVVHPGGGGLEPALHGSIFKHIKLQTKLKVIFVWILLWSNLFIFSIIIIIIIKIVVN